MEEEVAAEKGRTRKACGGSQGGERFDEEENINAQQLLRKEDGHCQKKRRFRG